jgi:hypothetical protein
VIKIPISIGNNRDAIRYLEEEVDRGTASHHIDGKYSIITFYNPEDESAFILKFGKDFPPMPRETGAFYCPYIPAGFK